MDTPYYEQLQYVGDTRIQALISYAVAGDDRLGRQAIAAFDESRTPDGITLSRYPSSLVQTIPTFSLLWVGMVHDYWLYRPDSDGFVGSMVPGTRTVLDWFGRHEQPDGLLGKLPWWSFIDWVPSGEIPTYSASGESCVTTLEYLGALDEAADLERAHGDSGVAGRYQGHAAHLRKDIFKNCWSSDRGLIADNPDLTTFSQQANILAVLYDVIPKEHQQQLMRQILSIQPGPTRDGVLSSSYYFRFYLARALEHAGMADEYLSSIDPWRKMLALHFSTWPEIREIRAQTPTHGPRIPSMTCSRWLRALSPEVPASPRFASLLTWGRCRRSRRAFRIRWARSRWNICGEAKDWTQPSLCRKALSAASFSRARRGRSNPA